MCVGSGVWALLNRELTCSFVFIANTQSVYKRQRRLLSQHLNTMLLTFSIYNFISLTFELNYIKAKHIDTQTQADLHSASSGLNVCVSHMVCSRVVCVMRGRCEGSKCKAELRWLRRAAAATADRIQAH